MYLEYNLEDIDTEVIEESIYASAPILRMHIKTFDQKSESVKAARDATESYSEHRFPETLFWLESITLILNIYLAH